MREAEEDGRGSVRGSLGKGEPAYALKSNNNECMFVVMYARMHVKRVGDRGGKTNGGREGNERWEMEKVRGEKDREVKNIMAVFSINLEITKIPIFGLKTVFGFKFLNSGSEYCLCLPYYLSNTPYIPEKYLSRFPFTRIK